MRNSVDCELKGENGSRMVRLHELTVRDILDMGKEWNSGVSLVGDLERFLPRFSTLCLEDLLDMTPSELETIWGTFQEVNAAFFRIAEALGFGAALDAVKLQAQAMILGALLANRPDMPCSVR